MDRWLVYLIANANNEYLRGTKQNSLRYIRMLHAACTTLTRTNHAPSIAYSKMAPMAALLRLAVLFPLVAALPTSPSSISERAAPHVPVLMPWNTGAVTSFPIHSSCNATQRRQIEAGLEETIALAKHAKEHILRWGNESDIYRKYFGNRPTMEAVGAFDVVVNGDKANVLFRCDDPDDNCKLPGIFPFPSNLVSIIDRS